MVLLIGGQWTASQPGHVEKVTSPFDGVGARVRSGGRSVGSPKSDWT